MRSETEDLDNLLPDAGARLLPVTPLLRRIFATYLVLAFAAFCFPGGMVSWLDDHNQKGWLDAPLAAMRGVDSVSAALGVKQVGQRLRHGFAAAIGEDDS